jgi:hypothetical protein
MAQAIQGPNWPLNYIPTTDEWNFWLANGSIGRAIIQSMPCQLQTQCIYGVRTSIQPFNCIVPPLSSTQPGDWIMLYDIDYMADANPVTFTATGPDNIACYGNLAPTLLADVADFMAMLIANTTSWRAIIKLA